MDQHDHHHDASRMAQQVALQAKPTKPQELLGHSTIKMTMRYAHLSQTVRKDAVSVLDDLPRGTLGAPDLKSAVLPSQVTEVTLAF